MASAESERSNQYIEPIVVRGEGLPGPVTLWRPEGVDQPLVRDLDLGEWLGFDRPRDVRKIIERHLLSLGEVSRHRGAKPLKGSKGGRPEEVYFLTEAQALKVVAKSETELADRILDHVITVYLALRRGGEQALPPSWQAQQEQRQREMAQVLELKKLELERDRLIFDRQQRQASALQAALAHPLFGEVGDDIKRAHLVTSVELATGMSLPALRPSASHMVGWMSPTEIARQTGSTPMAVGLAISRLWGTKRVEAPGRSKSIINTTRPKEGEPAKPVVSWLYSPPAVEQIIAEMSKKPLAGAAPKGRKAAA